MPKPAISRTLLSLCRLLLLIVTPCLSLLHPDIALAQERQVTFNISLTYSTHFENIIPSPLTVQPNSACSLQNSSIQVGYDAATNQIDYRSTATIHTFSGYLGEEGVLVDCSFTVFSAKSSLYIGDLIYYPSSGQIVAEFIPSNAGPIPLINIAHLLYVDMSNPGHVIYHFRGNDALFSIAQQTYGINFTGVELTFDVQAPSS